MKRKTEIDKTELDKLAEELEAWQKLLARLEDQPPQAINPG